MPMTRANSSRSPDSIAACEPLFVAIAAMLEEGATLAATTPTTRSPRAYAARAAALRAIGERTTALAQAIPILLLQDGDG
jgi:hypothetical protein